MKLNWGTSIAIFYSLFVIVMVVAVIKATQLGVPLVQEEYYDADMAYESFRTKKANTAKLHQKPEIQVGSEGQIINVQLPENTKLRSGSIQLYRPSQTGEDRLIALKLDSQQRMSIPTKGLVPGRWTVKLEWDSQGTPYYFEEDIVI